MQYSAKYHSGEFSIKFDDCELTIEEPSSFLKNFKKLYHNIKNGVDSDDTVETCHQDSYWSFSTKQGYLYIECVCNCVLSRFTIVKKYEREEGMKFVEEIIRGIV